MRFPNPKPGGIIPLARVSKYLKSEKSRKVEIVGFGKWKDYKFNEI